MEKGGYSIYFLWEKEDNQREELKAHRVRLRITEKRLLTKWLLKFLFHHPEPLGDIFPHCLGACHMTYFGD